MNDTRIVDLFQVRERFLRSVHLERDFADPKALNGYILTPQAEKYIQLLIDGLPSDSGRRAWRITGDFGAGKSSFALLVAHLFSEKSTKIPVHLRQVVNVKQNSSQRPRLLPVLVTGSREPLSTALIRALSRDLQNICGRGRQPGIIDKLKNAIDVESTRGIADETVTTLITQASNYVVESGKASGLLIILDELGKFLEFAAIHPDRQDVFLLQRLAEEAARSGRVPVFIIGLLHQGFSAYADNLSQTAQREWEKVAGRFEELFFNQPLEQIAGLVGEALNLSLKALPKGLGKVARAAMLDTIKLGWYGAPAVTENLLTNSTRLYPLHPTVLPVLVQLFSRFGQNQRSLFSFLISNEPCGLIEFAQTPVQKGEFYNLHHLYDYTRSTFGHRLGLQSYRSHWNLIESLIDSFPTDEVVELRILKTVGLLNLIDINSLLATEDAIVLAVASEAEGISAGHVRRAIKKLHREKRMLHYRGASGGYCLWPHTSVNLDLAYEKAVRALGQNPPQHVSPLIQSYLETRPLVARRHYIETGNLRHFDVHFSPVEKLDEAIKFDYEKSDGRIVIALCESHQEHKTALQFAQLKELKRMPEVLFAIPNPLGVLGKLFQEVQRWEWVSANTPELNNDSYAREEVSRQLANARQSLEKRVQSLVGLQRFAGTTELQWFYRGEKLGLENNRGLLEYLSEICSKVYELAPKVHNELINRREPSSAANGARTRLLQGIFCASSEPYLGMNPDKKPPEMAIYLSLLENGGVHRKEGDSFKLYMPDSERDKCNFRPALQRIGQILEARADSRTKVSDLMVELRKPPYGVRDGLSPILIALFAAINEQHIAFYDNGMFMREMAGLDIMRLTKVPDLFEIQYCKVAGVRSELFKQLFQILGQQFPNNLKPLNIKVMGERIHILDVVRPLCVFAAQLPAYTIKTKRLSATSIAVRSALLNAREPATLLFRDLPVACGFSAITSDSLPEVVEGIVEALKCSLEELRLAYLKLHERMNNALSEFFGVPDSINTLRKTLYSRADNILSNITELRLKGFCLQLIDFGLPETEWLDSLGSFVTGLPPQKWQDIDEEKFVQELELLVARFKRVESITLQRKKPATGLTAVRVAITNLDGTEIDDVIYVSQGEEKEIARIEAEVTKLLVRTKRVGLAATALAFGKALAQIENPTKNYGRASKGE